MNQHLETLPPCACDHHYIYHRPKNDVLVLKHKAPEGSCVPCEKEGGGCLGYEAAR